MNFERYLQKNIIEDLSDKMVFVGGPWQVGKTTLSLKFLNQFRGEVGPYYLNWDKDKSRKQILARKLPEKPGLVVFDEIHKYTRWRNFIKGWFDIHRMDYQFLVTGSAKLDVYRYGGDSLQGRYFYFRMHPFSLAETGNPTYDSLKALFLLSGFPEPFSKGSHAFAKRWSKNYHTRVIQDEIPSLESVKDLSLMETLLMRLPECVGSPLSINALREDLNVSHATVTRWLEIFEKLYSIFRIYPFGGPKIRAVKKEAKHYHFDWTVVSDPGARFENLVACHLLKWCHFIEDSEGERIELRYFRNVDGKEVDFVILKDQKPIEFIECKYSQTEPTTSLKYLATRSPDTKAYQISFEGNKDYRTIENIRVCPAYSYLKDKV
jgi:hypothetical protein